MGHKASHNTFKKTQVVHSIFSDLSGTKLEINKGISEKSLKSWKLYDMFLHNTCVEKEIKRDSIFHFMNGDENAVFQNLWDAAKTTLGGKL